MQKGLSIRFGLPYLASLYWCVFLGCAQSPSGTVWPQEPRDPAHCSPPCDRDNDGILDTVDNCPDHQNPIQSDQDGDHRGDVCDPEATIPNYILSKSILQTTPKMSDGLFVLQTQTKNTPHESDDGQFIMRVEVRP